MSRSRTRTAALGGGALAIAATALVATIATDRRWGRTPDPTAGDPLGLPPHTERTLITEDGAVLSVATMGPDDAATTFVLSHCWTGDRRVWAPVARLLAEEHRVVVYDQRGHGRSTIGTAGLTIDALADDLAAVVRLAAVEDARLVVAGHSMGGMAAQAFAIAHPDTLATSVDALVLVATACDDIGGSPLARTFTSLVDSRLLENAARHPRWGHLVMRPSVGRTVCTSHIRAVADTWVATPAPTRRALLHAMADLDLSGDLATIDVPVVVVNGTRDLLTPPARSRRIASLLPDVRTETFEGAGHMLPCEIPHELAQILRRTASAVDAPAAPTAAVM